MFLFNIFVLIGKCFFFFLSKNEKKNSLRISELNSLRDELSHSNSVGNSLFENSKPFSMSPSIMNNPSINEMTRLREEYAHKMRFEDRISIIQATQACEAWKTAVDESNRKVNFRTRFPSYLYDETINKISFRWH